MKRPLSLVRLTMLVVALLSSVGWAETLKILERRALDKYYWSRYAVRLGGDTLLFISDDGLFMQSEVGKPCRKLVKSPSANVQVPFSYCDQNQRTQLVSPCGMWHYDAIGQGEILVFESFCSEILRLELSVEGAAQLAIWSGWTTDDVVDAVAVQDGFVLSTLWNNSSKKQIGILQTDDDSYHRVFRFSDGLSAYRDTIGIAHAGIETCLPAFNPTDSTLWIAIAGYSHIYITDLNGELKDSVLIHGSDYRTPPRLRSRIKSHAVLDEWNAQWTRISQFRYVPTGYFLMQYRTGVDTIEGKIAFRSSKVTWNDAGMAIDIEIDQNWHIAGVEPDGRILFSAPELDSNGYKETIIVGRIEP